MGGRTGAIREARHSQVPPFTENTPINRREGGITEDPPCVFACLQPKALDRAGVRNRGALPVPTVSSAITSRRWPLPRERKFRGWGYRKGVQGSEARSGGEEEDLEGGRKLLALIPTPSKFIKKEAEGDGSHCPGFAHGFAGRRGDALVVVPCRHPSDIVSKGGAGLRR